LCCRGLGLAKGIYLVGLDGLAGEEASDVAGNSESGLAQPKSNRGNKRMSALLMVRWNLPMMRGSARLG